MRVFSVPGSCVWTDLRGHMGSSILVPITCVSAAHSLVKRFRTGYDYRANTSSISLIGKSPAVELLAIAKVSDRKGDDSMVQPCRLQGRPGLFRDGLPSTHTAPNMP